MFDIYGTHHDRRLWKDPQSFQPERFRGWTWEDDPYSLVAQGAGGHSQTHRCPGEWNTVELIKRAISKIATSNFTYPTQDTSIALNELPALPRSGLVFTKQ